MLAMIKFVARVHHRGDNIQYHLLQELQRFQAQSQSLDERIESCIYTNGECFPVVGHIARCGDGGGGRCAARSLWKAGPSVLIGFVSLLAWLTNAYRIGHGSAWRFLRLYCKYLNDIINNQLQ